MRRARRLATLALALVLALLAARPARAQWTGDCDSTSRPATRAAVATAAVAGNAALLLYFKSAWWSGERAKHFFFHADWDQQFRDQDKFGHMWGGYHLTRGGAELLELACVRPRKAVMLSAAYSLAFQTQIEIWDGLYAKYGFSYADMLANASGASLAVLNEEVPRSRAIKPTIWYKPTKAWRNRNEPGHGNNPRATLDYSGQSYWFSADVDSLLPAGARPYWPGFLRLSVGHSITDWVNPNTGAVQRAQRKILLSVDFDAEKLPGNAPAWKWTKHQLSFLHIPGPTLQLTPKVRGLAWYP